MTKPFLVFDAYGTLLELDDFYGRLQRGFETRGAMLPLDAVKKAAHREMRHYIGQARRAVDEAAWLALRAECAAILGEAIREQGHALDLSHEATLAVLADAIVFEPYEETRTVLHELKARGVGLAVASNWDYQLPQVLEQHKLAGYFDFSLASASTGYEKPEAGFFELAWREATAAGGEAGQIYYIGDHYEKDVAASRAGGFVPLWLVREERDVASGETGELACGVARLGTLRDLLTLF
jgi:FMN phosphatase YigB (HAD superfamily)